MTQNLFGGLAQALSGKEQLGRLKMCETSFKLCSDWRVCLISGEETGNSPSNSSQTTSPVIGTTLTIPIRTRSSVAMPPIPISTKAKRAFVDGAADPGTTGSSLVLEDAIEGSSTYLT